MIVQAYLDFNGRCEEAVHFYRDALDAKVNMLMRFQEAPEGQCAGGTGDKVMHVSFRIGDTEVMASDGRCTGQTAFQGISLSLALKDKAEAKRYFDALTEGGTVEMPLTKTFWSPCFGMVTDRFGVSWMVNVIA